MKEPSTIKVTINPDVLLEELDNEAVLLSTKSEHYFGLDEMGLTFWKLLNEHKESALVLKAIVAEYDVDHNSASQDLVDFIQQLEQANLVTTDNI